MTLTRFPRDLSNISNETYETTGRKLNPVDAHVGGRIRYRRMIIGMSQETMSGKMNLTFQQIQKYEKGANRIGASALFRISKILEVPVGYFFEGLLANSTPSDQPLEPRKPDREPQLRLLMNSREGLDLNTAFAKIGDRKIRRNLIDLIRSLAQNQEASEKNENA